MSSVATAGAPATSKAKAPKKPRAHPTYHEMIKEAIVALKERTGSSQIAIAKFIEEKQRPNLPANFKKLLLVQLKKLVANGKLVKVKNSFKLPPKSPSAAADGRKPAKTSAKTSTGHAKKTAAKAPEPKPKRKAAEATGAEKKSAPVKRKATEPAKPKATKAAKTAAMKSPGKKAGAAEKKTKKAPKSIKSPVKKPKSIKSPVKKAAGVKKARK